MTFWFLAGLMVAVAAAVLIWPLARRRSAAARRDYDLAVYRDQMAELERDLAAGLVEPDQAEAAKAEIARRMLALEMQAGEEAASGSASSPVVTRAIAVAIVLLLPAAALSVYWLQGEPGLPGLPLAERETAPPAIDSPNAAMIVQVKRRLADHPDDGEAWLLLAGLYRRDGLAAESAEAYRQAIALDPERPEALMGLAESLVALHRGTVVPEARQLFARVLEMEPNTPMAFYYAGLALAQDGRLEEARGVWTRLLNASSADAPWVPVLRRQIARLAEDLDGEGATGGQSPGEQSPAEREAFIRSMVTGLENRLQDDPEDLEGWIMLARSYRVLGENKKAAEALAHAETLAEDLPDGSPLAGAVAAERDAQSGTGP
jgi:cytochrome c-type biogenesis protein CcmH